MSRIDVGEFVEDLVNDQPVLRDGHELGLIIDESNGTRTWCAEVLNEISARVPIVRLPVSALQNPRGVADAVCGAAAGSALVIVEVREALTAADYTALQSIVDHHGVYQWNYAHTEGSVVNFHDGARFVLLSSRHALEATAREMPLLWEMIGLTISVDGSQQEVA